MELQPITCPKCGGTIQAPVGGKTCFCTFCGTQIYFDDGSRSVTYRTVDEARIKELELERQRLELEEQRRPGKAKLIAVLAIIGTLMMVIGTFAGHASGDSDSPWYMIALLGFFPLAAVVFIWIESSGSNNGGTNA